MADDEVMSEDEVRRRLSSAHWTMEQFEDFINGPGLIEMLEAHPHFTEDLSRSFFRKFPELLPEFVSDQGEPKMAERYLPRDLEESRSPNGVSSTPSLDFDAETESRRKAEEEHREKIKEIANDCSSLSKEVFLFKEVKRQLTSLLAHDEAVLYLTTDDKKYIYECGSRKEGEEQAKIKGFRPFEANKNTLVAAYVAATGHPVTFEKFSCGATDCQDESFFCTCNAFPLTPKKSTSVICQVLTDCDHNLLAVYELRRWRDGGHPPFSEEDSIKMLHVLLWGGITIGSALEHKKLKDEKEMRTTLASFEEELLQQMNLLWYQVGKLKQVIQKTIPRTSDVWVFLISDDDEVMRVKTADDDGCEKSARSSTIGVDPGAKNSFDVRVGDEVSWKSSARTWGAVSRWEGYQAAEDAVDQFVLPLRDDVNADGYLEGAEDSSQLTSKYDSPTNSNMCGNNEHGRRELGQSTTRSDIEKILLEGGFGRSNNYQRTSNCQRTSNLGARIAGTSFTEPSLKSWPIGTGISGAAAETKKILNVANVKDHEKYSADIDNLKHNLDVRAQLSVPVFMELDAPAYSQEQQRVCAVITLVSEIEGLFSRLEVDLVQRLADCCGHAFVQGQQFEKYHDAEVQRIVNMELHAAHSEPNPENLGELLIYVKQMEAPVNLERLDFCGWNVQRTPKVAFLIHMFNRLFESKFDYDKVILAKFFLVVSINYRNDVHYHNFNHAFEVAQKIYAVLVGCPHGFTLLESMALFLAGICHDLDHRGLNNKFNNDQRTLLANLHKDATMEHHHFRMTVAILTHGKTNFLINWPASRYQELMSCIKYCILSTDLPTGRSHYIELMKMYPGDGKIHFEWQSKRRRHLLMSVVMSIADFHMSYQSWTDYRRILDPLLEEFWAQGDLEKSMGRDIEKMLDRKEAKDVPELQMAFIAHIPLPTATIFARIFVEAEKLVENCKRIYETWKEKPEFSAPQISTLLILPKPCSSDSSRTDLRRGLDE